MPAPTFTPGDEKQDEKLNPGQRDYDRRFNDIARAEEQGTFSDIANNYDKTADPKQEDANIKRLQDDESSGTSSGGWTNNVDAQPKQQKWYQKGWFKKGGPVLGVGGIIGIGGFVLVGLASPSLLIVQLKETMVGRFNTQLSSMEARSNKLIFSKINGATSGFCNSRLTIKCKFTSMNDKQIAKLKAAGIDIEVDKTTVTGRSVPKSLTFDGKTIAPKDFASTAGKDVKFRNALKQAYNPKYAGFTGKAWSAVASKFKINKNMPELNANEDPEKAKEKINTIAKEGVEDTGTRTSIAGDAPDCDKTSTCTGFSEEDADKINSNTGVIKESADSGAIGNELKSRLAGLSTGNLASFAKITGAVDSACAVYSGVTALSYAGKAIRAAQLVRYAMIFLSVSDAIKGGGNPDPEDVALLGGVLTSTVKDSADPTKTVVGSATDSYGYKYAAYGDSSASDQSMTIANRFMAGGGFVGEMSTTTATILSFIPGGRQGARDTCHTLANPFVQGGSLILGIATLFVPGANVGKTIAQMGIGAAVGIVIATLPGLLADIVAGTVTENIAGEESGNAITSGSGSLMSDALAAQNGNGPMSKSDAIAYNNLQDQTNNQYIADELETTSPFDATNPHTFLGSITSALIPLQTSSNPLTKIGTLLHTSLSSIVPNSQAISTDQYSKSLNVCQDPDVIDGGYAADPFCNVIRGIPPKYLDKDPLVVIDQLVSSGNLTDSGTPSGAYKDFITNCITNEAPLGYEDLDAGYNPSTAQGCVVNDSNANYYLNYVDQRVDLGLSDEDDGSEKDASAAQITERPPNAADRGNGWTLANDTDYSSYPCDPRTQDLGPYTNPDTGATIRLCAVSFNAAGNADLTSGTNGASSIVASLISVNLMNMFEAAQAEGVSLGISDGFRRAGGADYSTYSQHGRGLAVDLGAPKGGSTICFSGGPSDSSAAECRKQSGVAGDAVRWLDTNAAKYGFQNLKGEPWHWSTGEL